MSDQQRGHEAIVCIQDLLGNGSDEERWPPGVKDTDALRAYVAKLQADAKHWREEADGYQSCVKAAQDDPQSRTIVSVHVGGGVMRIYGPTPNREIAMGETVAQYLKILQIMVEHEREKDKKP